MKLWWCQVPSRKAYNTMENPNFSWLNHLQIRKFSMAMLGPILAQHGEPSLVPWCRVTVWFRFFVFCYTQISDGHAYDVGFIDIHILKKQSTTI